MRISDWSSDVCSSDLIDDIALRLRHLRAVGRADEAVEVERLPRHVAHELHPLHRHAGVPEEEDVETGDEDVVGLVAREEGLFPAPQIRSCCACRSTVLSCFVSRSEERRGGGLFQYVSISVVDV